ncbi:MAG: porin [Gammaproteobacteria bacterium]|nr:porin [Gammaproteobacteria bacterium]
MKRPVLLALSASLAAAGATPALAGFPTVYGKINVSANQYDFEKIDFAGTSPNFSATGATDVTDELDNSSIESNSSRIGVRGDFDVAEGLTAIYRLEYGTDVDNGTNSNGREFSQRNIFGGLQGGFGTVIAGKNDTPLKTAQTNAVTNGDIDRFNDLPLADLGSYLVGENRADNTVQYTSPVLLGGLVVNIASIQLEETGVEVSDTNQQDDNGFGSGASASVSYGKGRWFVALAVDENVATTDTIRFAGEAILGPVSIGAVYQTAEKHAEEDFIGGYSNFVGATPTSVGSPTTGLNPLAEWDGAANTVSGTTATPTARYDEQDGYLVNALWKIAGRWSAKVQYGHSTSTPTNELFDDVDIDAIAAGVDYKFNDNFKLYGYYATLETQGDEDISTKATTDTTAGLGLDLRF